MQHIFTLHEDAWFRNSSTFARGPAVGYRVGGLPNGKTARIANFGAPTKDDWRIMPIDRDNGQASWTGHYENIEDALTALKQSCQ